MKRLDEKIFQSITGYHRMYLHSYILCKTKYFYHQMEIAKNLSIILFGFEGL